MSESGKPPHTLEITDRYDLARHVCGAYACLATANHLIIYGDDMLTLSHLDKQT
jgi:hypothetical protein